MKAGREMDALVAEKVMGLVLTCPVDPRFDHSVGTNRDGSSAKRNFCRWPDGREHWIPFFSTDISDAWQVVEKLTKKIDDAKDGDWMLDRLGYRCCEHDEDGVHGEYRCMFCCYPNDETRLQVDATADTAPLAICLAALKAVGVDVESPK